MTNLYLDFDGVLVDTITITYKMMYNLGISLNDRENVIKFYQQLNWYQLLENISEINNSFYNIRLLKELGSYNLNILTTVNSLEEIKAKISYIRSKDKDINVISVPKGIEKADAVKAKNAILVDDYSGNLKLWKNKGGIPIKFSNENNKEYITINNLNSLTNKKLIKKLTK